MTVAEFWDLTPRETAMVCEATAWRMEQMQELALSLAWHTAALSRAKRIPTLQRLIKRLRRGNKPPPPLEERAAEFEELTKRMLNRG